MNIEKKNFYRKLIDRDGEAILDRILLLENPEVVKGKYYHNRDKSGSSHLSFDGRIEHNGSNFFAFQMYNEIRRWTVVPGKILEYKKINLRGVLVTTVALISSEDEKKELEKLLRTKGFEGEFFFWDYELHKKK